MALTSGTRLGPYEITGAIGAGGMGEVYQAHDTKLGRDVAIKVLPEAFAHDPDRLSRFQREAKMLAALNHPNIATIHGLEQSNGMSYLVMELVSGETLAERVKREGAVPIEDALAIAKQIAEALEAAHEKGIIHRDLKPANVKVTPEGKVKVLDFGLAKAFAGDAANEEAANSPTLSMAATMQGVILGTAAYMSPEQARGKAVNKATDIWAFGCVLYELLCGHPAFEGEDATDILAAVVKTEPDWSRLPEATPSTVQTLLRRCLRKDKRQRLTDVTGARIEIEDALAWIAEGGSQAGIPAPGAWRRGLWQSFAWGTAAIAIVIAALATSVLYFRRAPAEVRPIRFVIGPPEKATFLTAPNLASISPDGTRLAFVAADSSGKSLLWIRALDSLTAQPLSGTDEASQPFWSPDSRFIAFSAEDKLKKIAVAGGPPQTVARLLGSWEPGTRRA